MRGAGGSPPRFAAGRASWGYHRPGARHFLHYPYYRPFGFGYYYGWPGWSWWPYSYPYYYYYYPYSYPAYVPYYRLSADERAPAAVETRVRPRRAEVWVDGALAGRARDYDGDWDRLWLEPGRHTLEFRAEGYFTLRLRVDLPPGIHLSIDERLAKGQGLDPRSRTLPGPGTGRAESPGPAPEAEEREREPARGSLRSGLLYLDVSPGDAAVYLDGEFLARAEELSRLHGALPVAEGPHTVEIVRPGYAGRTVRVEIEPGEPARVEVHLRPARPTL